MRRGSALIVTIGTLAVIAVFAAIYVTIGQSDQRLAATVRQDAAVAGVADQVADYIARVIADDRLDTYPTAGLEAANGFPTTVWRREAIDLPVTDFTMRSTTTGNAAPPEQERFNPRGNHTIASVAFGGNPEQDARIASDPFLASSEPEFAGYSLQERRFSQPTGGTYRPELFFLDHRDWRHISNLAPDGRFVNLFNLRNNFDAAPGFGLDADGNGRTSHDLTVLTIGTGNRVQATLDLPYSTLTADDPEARRTPAFFDTNQRFMAFPIGPGQDFTIRERRGGIATWASPDFPDYSYADADGDGFADSRWAELVDAADSNNPDFILPVRDWRFFYAARVVDLSSLVNVNTATDQLIAPTLEAPPGITPADVDLRRILTMEFAADTFQQPNDPLQPLSPINLRRPETGEPTPADYDGWDLERANDMSFTSGNFNGIYAGRFGYTALRHAIQGFGTGGEPWQQLAFASPDTGSASMFQFDASPFSRAYPGTFPNAAPLYAPGNATYSSAADEAGLRARYYAAVGRLDPTNPTSRKRATTNTSDAEFIFGDSLFGTEDLVELLTFRGLNDSGSLSRLEVAVSGRYDSGAAADAASSSLRLSPFFTNRPTDLDRNFHDSVNNTNPATRAPDGIPDTQAMAMLALSPRARLTTISGAAPIANREIETTQNGQPSTDVDPEDVLLNGTAASGLSAADNLRPTLDDVRGSATAAFSAYADALLGEVPRAVAAWDPADPRFPQFETLAYGSRGAELALRLAGHLAVNLVDAVDGNTDPTIATLLVDNDFRATLPDNTNQTANVTSVSGAAFGWWEAGGALDLGPATAAAAANARTGLPNALPTTLDNRQAVNVYGIEPQPILAEVGSVMVYMDAPERAGGDVEYRDNPNLPVDPRPVTLNGSTQMGNADLLFQAVFFQIHNPFDVSVKLPARVNRTGDVIDAEYTVEFGGRFYPLVSAFTSDNGRLAGSSGPGVAPADQYDAMRSIGPGESIIFWATAHRDLRELTNRWEQAAEPYVAGGLPGFPTVDDIGDPQNLQFMVERWIMGQTGEPVRPDNRLNSFQSNRVFPVNPETGAVNPAPFIDLLSVDTTHRPTGASIREARLWRKSVLPAVGGAMTEPEHLFALSTDEAPNVQPALWWQNDQLVDRLAQPQSKTPSWNSDALDVRLGGGNRNILGTQALLESSSQAVALDNTGFTMIRWASIRRPDHPDGTGAYRNAEAGELPAWLVEVRGGGAGAANVVSPANGTQLPGGALDAGDFADGTFYTNRRAFDFFPRNGMAPSMTGVISHIIPTLAEDRVDPSEKAVAMDLRQAARLPQPPGDPSSLNDTPSDVAGNDLADAALRTKFNADTPSSRLLRPADLLAMVPIGSVHAPLQNPAWRGGTVALGTGHPLDPDEWITLPEAIALALGVDQTTPNLATEPNKELYTRLLDTANGTPARRLLPGLRLDPFAAAPFVNANATAEVAPTIRTFDPVQGDFLVGPGLSPAMRLLSNIDALGDYLESQNIANAASDLRLTNPYRGKININTASLNVLRSLPGLTPSLRGRLTPGSIARAEYWPALIGTAAGASGGSNALGLPDLGLDFSMPAPITTTGTQFEERPDIAPLLHAYRDRRTPDFRRWSFGLAGPNSGFASTGDITAMPTEAFTLDRLAGFGPDGRAILAPDGVRGPATQASAFIDAVADVIDTNFFGDLGRTKTNGIQAIRSAPGFAGVGEVLGARIADTEPLLPGQTAAAAGNWSTDVLDLVGHNSIDALGRDSERLLAETSPGADPNQAHSLDTLLVGAANNQPDMLVDDADERLAAVNALLNTIDVRSDYFAAWFVIRGYRPADVENLDQSEPMVPGYQRRYLMILDRSNVVREGDRPRIVAYREVPL